MHVLRTKEDRQRGFLLSEEQKADMRPAVQTNENDADDPRTSHNKSTLRSQGDAGGSMVLEEGTMEMEDMNVDSTKKGVTTMYEWTEAIMHPTYHISLGVCNFEFLALLY